VVSADLGWQRGEPLLHPSQLLLPGLRQRADVIRQVVAYPTADQHHVARHEPHRLALTLEAQPAHAALDEMNGRLRVGVDVEPPGRQKLRLTEHRVAKLGHPQHIREYVHGFHLDGIPPQRTVPRG
jgi:hypothetical protein